MPVVAVTNVPEGAALGLAALVAVLLGRGFMRQRGTTLTAPCVWALVAVVSLACAAAMGIYSETVEPQINHAALRFAVAALALCPLMGVLGAKRPQDRGWQWVVLTLWIVVVGPAAQAVLLPQGVRLELFVAWKIFLVGLIGVGLLNYLPTRHALSAIFVAAGQLVLLSEFLGNTQIVSLPDTLVVGMGCFAGAAVLASRPPKKQPSPPELASFTAQWRSFRDAFGAFWALRILGRINQSAELLNWPIRLNWSGFTTVGSQPTQAELAELEQQLETLLRRFVKPLH
ncbi:MAG: hypothetical protein MI725_16415 [Pirellulales bacterium]|nr:hypothetical protein [Pirellulales bacterium]